jgi:folate-binding protein YgfZ
LSVAEDYRALRHGLGAFWLERDVVAMRGPDAVEYLQGQCSQDVVALGVGECADALLLSPQGKVDALVRVTRIGDEEMVLDVDGGYGAAVAARLERFKLRVKAEIGRLEWRCLALRGPAAAGVEGAPGTLALPFAWGGVSGIDLLGADPQTPAGARACLPEAWEAVRVEAGIPRMAAEIDDRTIPAEAGLLQRCVSFEKGCYTGQELVARLDARGNRVARLLRGIVFDAPADVSPEAVHGADVLVGDKTVGTVTSAAWSPGLGTLVGLAYLHRRVEPPASVEVRFRPEGGVDDGPGRGESGGREWSTVPAEARALPLVT